MSTLLSLELEPIINVRKQTLNGREYVVADVVILKEGVLKGSKGPLFYPAEEIERYPGMWNGMPITANHPMRKTPLGDLRPASAREPDMWNQYHVGFLFNDQYDSSTKTRKAQAWYDVEVANRVDSRIIPSILSGKQINVSTGLFTSDDPVSNESDHNGTKYTHIARNYRADHLATLLDDKGACSINDGCGININQDHSESTILLFSPEVVMNRDQVVQWLTTNCDCWKGKEELLKNDKSFTDDELKKLKANAEKSTLAINTLREIGTTLGVKDNATIDDLKTHAKSMKDKADSMDDDDDEETKGKKKMKTNKEDLLAALKGLPEKEVLAIFPTLNQTVQTAQGVIDEKRYEIMKELVANYSDEEKKAKLLKLKDKSLTQLQEIREFATTQNVETKKDDNETFLANFFGAQGGPSGGTGGGSKTSYDQTNALLPSINLYDDEEVEAA